MHDATEVIEAIESLFDAIKEKDVPRIQGHYVQDDRLLVFLEGPQSKVEGFDQAGNESLWRALFGVVSFTELELAEDRRAGRDHDLGWMGGTIRMAYTALDGSAPFSVEARGTWVLERAGQSWRIVFEHVSLPVAEPYPLPGGANPPQA